jgi:hypothetical protein
VGGLVYFLSAPTRHTATIRGLDCKAAGQTRAKIWRGLSYVVRDAEFGIAPGGGFQTQFSSRLVVGIAQLVRDCGSRAPQAAGIRVAAFSFAWWGFLDVVVT